MDLSTDYLGLQLENPVVVSACQPLSRDIDKLKLMEAGGAGAVVLHSLFEEQIVNESETLDHYLSYKEESFAEALTFFPEMKEYSLAPEKYLDLLETADEKVDLPVVASLNGVSAGGWVKYAEKIEAAGADALELNVFYVPDSIDATGREMEEKYVEIVERVRAEVALPLGVKVGPYFSSIPSMASRLVEAGADGLVLFNRFYQPDFEIEELEVVSDLQLSRSYDMRLPLRWVALLHGRVDADFAVTTGVHTYRDVAKAVMAGAGVTMLASELLANGPGRMQEITSRLADWMEEKGYESLRQMRGSMSQESLGTSAAIERANYTRALHSWSEEPGAGKYSEQ